MYVYHTRSARSEWAGPLGQASAAESGNMQPICGAAGKDVFCGINSRVGRYAPSLPGLDPEQDQEGSLKLMPGLLRQSRPPSRVMLCVGATVRFRLRFGAGEIKVCTASKKTRALKCKTLGVVCARQGCFMRMLDKINYWAGFCSRRWQFSIELERRRLSKNAAFIRPLEPLKPLVSLV